MRGERAIYLFAAFTLLPVLEAWTPRDFIATGSTPGGRKSLIIRETQNACPPSDKPNTGRPWGGTLEPESPGRVSHHQHRLHHQPGAEGQRHTGESGALLPEPLENE